MENKYDYSKYKCPYSHLEKESGHELKGPEGYSDTYGVWCACGYRGPVFYLNPEELGLKEIESTEDKDILYDLSKIKPSEKTKLIERFAEIFGEYALKIFYQLGLKTHFETMLINDANGDEFILSLKKVNE